MGILHDKPISSHDAHRTLQLLESVKLRCGRELERIREEEQLLWAREAAKQDAENKIKFLADMSHEIRTPMNAVIALTDLLLQERETLSEEQIEHLEVIQTSGHHLLTVINDILDISKLNHDPKLKLEKRKFSLRKCMKDTLNMARHQATTNMQNKIVHLIECPPDVDDSSSLKQILSRVSKESTTSPLPRVMKGKTLLPLVWKIERDVPDILIGDSMRLTQIVLNLCSNAVKFTKEGHIEVNIKRYIPNAVQTNISSITGKPMYEAKIEHIRSRVVRESTAQKAKQASVANPAQEGSESVVGVDQTVILEISVRDTGIGIPSDRLPKLFKSFSQIDISTARRYGGTGLGLAISSTLVNHMGGGLWVESEEGVGSRFALTIPIVVAPNQPDTPGNRSSDGWTPLTSPPSPCSTSSEGTSGTQSLNNEGSQEFVSPASGCNTNEENLAISFPIKILLAEDNVLNQKIAISILKRLGYTGVEIANNGREVLDALRRSRFDVIFVSKVINAQ
ncbi:hypothetical protein BGW37DRAFT_429208 [Umbelopsis sp. PMI_123]|nr:hypothetical protein BGW37DRAFT_429208 [Umbelopsis sp. PMI_123]